MPQPKQPSPAAVSSPSAKPEPALTPSPSPQPASTSAKQNPTPTIPAKSEPESPSSSAHRKGKGGRKAANPHLTDEERRRERVLKNRESAMKSLQKKKRYTEDLEHRALLLSKRNAELKQKIRLLVTRLNSHIPIAQNVPQTHHQPSQGIPVTAGMQQQTMQHMPHDALFNPSASRHIPTAALFPNNNALPHQAQHQQQQQNQHQTFHPTPPVTSKSTVQATNLTIPPRHTEASLADAVSMTSPLPTTTPLPASSNFSPIDDWVPALSDPFITSASDAATSSLPLPLPTSSSQTSQPLSTAFPSATPTSPHHSQPIEDSVGDALMGLGINVALALGNAPNAVSSPLATNQPSVSEPQFSLSGPADVADKISTPPFDVQHMACSQ